MHINSYKMRYYNIMKKFLFLLMALPAICLFTACKDSDDDDDPQGGGITTKAFLTEKGYYDGLLYYMKTSNTPLEVTVSGAVETAENVEIPTVVNIDGADYACTSISAEAFEDCHNLNRIIISGSIRTIGERAFKNCTGLSAVAIPSSVTAINNETFEGCTALNSLSISNSVTMIGNSAFSGCSGLVSVNIGNGVTLIGNYAFSGCDELTTLNIGNNVRKIGEGAFYACSSLTDLTLPNSVTEIHDRAFNYCTGLTTVTISSGVTYISSVAFSGCNLNTIRVAADNQAYDSRENCNAVIETKSNTLVIGTKNTVIPNGVTTIGSSAFQNCNELTAVTIPNSVTTIGSYAFYGCGLNSVTIPNSVTSIGNDAFAACRSLRELTISDGEGVLEISPSHNSINSFANSPIEKLYLGRNIKYNNSGYYNGASPFANMTSLIFLTIGDKVTELSNYAFYGCYYINTIVSFNITPPTISDDTFENVTMQNAPLYVPIGSENDYRNASGWRNFWQIREGTPNV